MKRRGSSLVVAILSATTMPAFAQWLHYPTPGIPRTPDGKPYLSAPAPRNVIAGEKRPQFRRFCG